MIDRVLSLDRPLVVIDLETTGKNPRTARIVELAYRVYPPDEISYAYESYINPGVPIPTAVTEIHGIGDATVAEAPTFARLLRQYEHARADLALRLDPGPLWPLLEGGVDYAGFNVRYDLEVLTEECRRSGFGLSMEGVRVVDAFRLWQILEPRTLSDAVRHFLGRPHDGAHGALADIDATEAVLVEQIQRYHEPAIDGASRVSTIDSVQALHDLQFPRDPSWIDDTGRFIFDEQGRATIAFGKHAGTPLATLDKGFLRWMLGQNFSNQAKLIARNALSGVYPRRADDAR